MFARAAKNDATITASLEHAILYPVDCEKGEGLELAKRYGIRGYPTFKMVDAKGEEIAAWIGYEGPEKWAAAADAGVADQRTLTAKAEAFAAQPTPALARVLAQAASTNSQFADAVAYYRKAREIDPAGMAEYTEGIFTSLYYGAGAGAFAFAEVDAEAKMIVAMAPEAASKMQVSYAMVRLARKMEEPAAAVRYLTTAQSIAEGSEDEAVLGAWEGMAIDYALLVEQDEAAAVALKKAAMDEGWADSADGLNNFAWWCFENGVNLEEAGELALKGIELAETDEQRANILDTAAEICNARGDCEEAIAKIKEAIALDPDKQYLKDQLVRFERELAEKKG